MYEVDTDGTATKTPDLKILGEWADALESGEYAQTTGTLKNTEGYCCLGVLSEMAVKAGVTPESVELTEENYDTGEDEPTGVFHFTGHEAYPPAEVVSWVWGDDEEAAGYGDPYLLDEDGDPYKASDLNDSVGYTFAQIAAAIRRTYNL